MSKDTEKASNIVTEDEFLQEIGIIPKEDKNKSTEEVDPDKEFEDMLNSELENKDVEKKTEKDNKEEGSDDKKDNSSEKDVHSQREQEIEAQEEQKLKRFGVKDTIDILIENGIWEDVAVKYGDKEYSSISELLTKEKPTKELFDSLSQLEKGIREKNLEKDYIPIKGKDESKIKLINAILSDVDYEDLLSYNKNVVEPVKKIDFTTVKGEVTEGFVRQCLKDIDNIPDKYLDVEIEDLKKNFKLIEKAEELQKIVIDNFNNEVDLRNKAKQELLVAQQKEQAENIKKFRKLLRDDQFTDSFAQKASQLRYAKDEDGKYHYEKLLADKLKDDSFSKKFIHFLMDEEDFIKKNTAKAKTDSTVKMMELVHIIPKGKGSVKTEKPSSTDDEFLKEITT